MIFECLLPHTFIDPLCTCISICIIPRAFFFFVNYQLRLVKRKDPNSRIFEETFTESSEVFRKYQMSIHKEKPEDCATSSYKGFLVDSPLKVSQKENEFKFW